MLRLSRGVRFLENFEGRSYLISPNGRVVHVSRSAMSVAELLQIESDESALKAELLRRGVPRTKLDENFSILIQQFQKLGILEGTTEYSSNQLEVAVDLAPAARAIANYLRKSKLRIASALLLIGFPLLAAAFVSNGQIGQIPNPCALPIGTLLFFLIVLPSHELGHAVTAILLDVPLVDAKIKLRYKAIPFGQVRTLSAQTASRTKRFAIIIAGPLTHLSLIAQTFIMMNVIPQNGLVRDSLIIAFCVSVSTLIAALNPFLDTDGSQALETVLSESATRATALGFRNPHVKSTRLWIHRLVCVAYVFIVLATIVAFARVAVLSYQS